MRRIGWSCTVTALLVVAANCGGDGTGPSTLQIAGQWNHSESFGDPALQLTCNNQGTATLTQSGASFTGTLVQTGTCTDPEGPFDQSGTFLWRNGSISGTAVTWNDDSDPACQYSGTISGSPPNRLSGTLQCTGSGLNLQGTWEMTR